MRLDIRVYYCNMTANTTIPLRFDCITFDWDGTLFDSTAIITRCIQGAVVEVGGARPSDEAASYVIGLGLMQANHIRGCLIARPRPAHFNNCALNAARNDGG